MINRLPVWFKQDIPDGTTLEKMRMICASGINTVCKESKCPNFSACLKDAKLTFMILGNTCTRNCRFCAVNKLGTAQNLNLDPDEPGRIADFVKELKLNYVVITSVTRDDLSDGGAEQFAKTIKAIYCINNALKVEALIPDFSGKITSLQTVIKAHPSVLAHNMETVKCLYNEIRPLARYEISLEVLRKAKEINPFLITKSALILGLGEKEKTVLSVMKDLRQSKCDILTLGQYLAPSEKHYPVKEFISIEQFRKYRAIAVSLGFKSVLSGPLVRSSYQADKVYREVAYA